MRPLQICSLLSFAVIGWVIVHLTVTRNGMKRWLRRDNPAQETKPDLECPSERNISDEEHVGVGSNDVGPSDQCSISRKPSVEASVEPSVEPKHRIFLSHSGAQKNFTWQLCEDLERVQHYPFFDRRDDSLPKGEEFPPLIFKAARQCRIAVLVISDEFFTHSKWPMIELNAFVKAQGSNNQGLKILPLFLGITMEQFHDKKRQARWFKKWKEFACTDERIDVEAWKGTLLKIPGGLNAMEYNGVTEGEVVFRGKVVEAICKLLCPDVKYDVSHVQSLEQLCEPILKKMNTVKVSSRFGVKVVGLYGMGGVGKTTISRAICNEMFEDFNGRVCHVELGGNDQVELQKRVLREVTYANASILEIDPNKLDDLLKQRMHRQNVFLVLDNVWDDHVEEALKYLKIGHHAKSMVLVTSRSIRVLNRLSIEECNCMEMSNLEYEGARNILLHYSGNSWESIGDESKWEIVERCVKKCYFSTGEISSWDLDGVRRFHPLALKALGAQLVTTEIKDWDEVLKVLDKFNMWKHKVHQVFSILGLGYDALQKDLQEIFLDLALLWKSKLIGNAWPHYVRIVLEWEWLCTLHSLSEEDMILNVKALERKGLLEKVNDITKLEYNIHDLYYEFAEVEAQARPFEERRFLLNKNGTDILKELEVYPPNGSYWPHLKRLIICNSEVQSLKGANLHHCKNVEVLVLKDCDLLEEVDVRGMDNLRLLVVFGCAILGNLTGLDTLKNLEYFLCHANYHVRMNLAFHFTRLRVVRVFGSLGLFQLDLSKCTKLYEVTLPSYCKFFDNDEDARVDISKYLPTSIQKLEWSPFFEIPFPRLAAFTNLQDLNLSDCVGVGDLTSLFELTLLKKLNVSWTKISEIPSGLWKLRRLQYLDVSNCFNLTSIVGIIQATTLQTILARGCKKLEKVPDDLSTLQHLEMLDLRGVVKISRLPSHPEHEGKLKVEVGGCWGLIPTLVQRLRGPEVARDACVDGCNCDSCESMGSWIAAKKRVNIVAFNWLKDVLRGFGYNRHVLEFYWSHLLDDENQVTDVLIRGLCEHDVRGSRVTISLADVLKDVTIHGRYNGVHHLWWVVVATSPCTFKVVTRGALMEPWKKTLLHHTIKTMLPHCLFVRRNIIKKIMLDTSDDEDKKQGDEGDESSSWFVKTRPYQAIVAVLQKCTKNLEDACDQGIDPMRCHEGKKLVHIFLRELKATKSEVLEDGSMLQALKDRYGKDYTIRYKELFPNFQFESTLGEEIVHFGRRYSEFLNDYEYDSEESNPEDILDG